MSTTFRVALLGDGIGESLTPAMHMLEGERLGLSYVYELFDIPADTFQTEGLVSFLVGLRAAGFDGLNVTHPYKQRVLGLVDDLSADAERIGAVNLITFDGERVAGHNTDWTGFRASLASQLDAPLSGTVLQIGSGGAGAATVYALLTMGADHVVIHDVDPSRARALADRYRPLFPQQQITATDGAVGDLWSQVTGVVHATPVGMDKHPGRPFDPALLSAGAWVAEVVYRPVETQLVVSARAAGHQVIDGSMMAVGQAIDSLRILTGLEPDADRVRADLLSLLAAEDMHAAAPH
jgi:shikimate dehydrogenase